MTQADRTGTWGRRALRRILQLDRPVTARSPQELAAFVEHFYRWNFVIGFYAVAFAPAFVTSGSNWYYLVFLSLGIAIGSQILSRVLASMEFGDAVGPRGRRPVGVQGGAT